MKCPLKTGQILECAMCLNENMNINTNLLICSKKNKQKKQKEGKPFYLPIHLIMIVKDHLCRWIVTRTSKEHTN